jgi:hypothetical protein
MKYRAGQFLERRRNAGAWASARFNVCLDGAVRNVDPLFLCELKRRERRAPTPTSLSPRRGEGSRVRGGNFHRTHCRRLIVCPPDHPSPLRGERETRIDDLKIDDRVRLQAAPLRLIDSAKIFLKLGLLGLLLIVSPANPHAAGALPQEVYIWQRSWTEPVRESVRQHATHFASVVVLAAEVTWHDQKPAVIRVAVDYPTLAKTATPVGITLRIGPFGGPFAADDATGNFLTGLAASLIAEARANQVEPRELEIDFDCAESKLDGYRVWVEAIQRQVAPVPVAITALPSWLNAAAFPALAHTASNYVLQVHSLERPKNFTAPFTLCDPQAAQLAVAQAVRIGVPFRVALPTYGYVLAFDRNGKFFDLSAEGPRKNWPVTTQVREIRADPIAIGGLVQNWSTNHPALLRGLIWYRLPVNGDNLNWRWPTLNAMLDARVLREQFRAEAHRVEPGLVEINLVNHGDLDIPSRFALEVHWSNARLIAGDGLRGFELAASPTSAAKFITKPERSRLPAGESWVIGWLRFNTNCEVQVEVNKF